MKSFVHFYKRVLYKFFYLDKDVKNAIKINNPERVSSELGDHIKDIFWKEYNHRVDVWHATPTKIWSDLSNDWKQITDRQIKNSQKAVLLF